ncbi:MAG: TolC family protein, partial [Parabacteroides sp.]|nr:TolC family protein [Parabacteroides sp.]
MPVQGTFPTGEAYSDVETANQPLPPWEVFFTNKNARQVIQMALENNRDLRMAMLNVDKARAQYGIQRSQLMPSVGAVATETASKTPATLSQTGNSYVSHSYQANLATSSWELDLFGRLRSLSDA